MLPHAKRCSAGRLRSRQRCSDWSDRFHRYAAHHEVVLDGPHTGNTLGGDAPGLLLAFGLRQAPEMHHAVLDDHVLGPDVGPFLAADFLEKHVAYARIAFRDTGPQLTAHVR